jgi:hypothetical protein
MSEVRECEQCGTRFVPRREHSRFCSAACRVAWNKEHKGHANVSPAALDWSLTAMAEATARLARIRLLGGSPALDAQHAAVAVSDATWWVTIVDATLVRYRPDSYDATLDALPASRQDEIEQALAGLRFVRNQMGIHLDPAEFIRVTRRVGRTGESEVTLTWNALQPPTSGNLSPSGQEWEHGRYLAYQERLAGRSVARTFMQAARFLRHAAGNAADATVIQDSLTGLAQPPVLAQPPAAAQ